MFQTIKYFVSFVLIYNTLSCQTITNELQFHLKNHIDFSGNLKNFVTINDSGIFILGTDKKIKTSLYRNEFTKFKDLLQILPYDSVKKIIELKGNRPFSNNLITSHPLKIGQTLKGKKIAIDAGHIAGDWKTAKIEQKYLQFIPGSHPKIVDTIRISEGDLTYKTSLLIKEELEKEGAIVFLTRLHPTSTSFGISYEEWWNKKKVKTLDSLESIGNINTTKKKALLKLNRQQFFWEFFRDYDLLHRCDIINAFKPDITLIVHYNVDEKNTDWIKPGEKNFTMAFIGGGMNNDAALKISQQTDLLRLLVSNDWHESRLLSSILVENFHKELKIPIAQPNNADYLKDHCLTSGANGVFCRNLVLCRKIAGPLVYGECLYQDNINECFMLSENEKNINGIKTYERVKQVADCYVRSVKQYSALK